MLQNNKAIFLLAFILCGAFFGMSGLEGGVFRQYLPGSDQTFEGRGEVQANVDLELTCLSKSLVDETKNRGKIDLALEACADELSSRVKGTSFETFGEEFQRALLAMTIAHNAAPYGPSLEMQYEQLIKEDALDCDNYAALMGHLIPEQDLDFIGFDGGHIGNHAQVLLHAADYSVLFDPTIGVAAITSYNDLLTGKEIGKEGILSIYPKPDNKPAIATGFHNKVIEALSLGLYKPSDALYFHDDMDYFLGLKKSPYLTPGGRSLRLRKKTS